MRKRARKKSAQRNRLTPRKEKRGLPGGDIPMSLSDSEVAELVAEITNQGGIALAAYREPLSGRPMILSALPLNSVEPTPFQRDLSPTHTKRLAQKIEESGSFLDPLIVVRGSAGRLWTPNGRHRLAAAKVLGLKHITALVSADEALAFRILALNTEKAHNLKDRSLEVVRMARELASRDPRAKELSFSSEFESAELLSLGMVYERNKRFAGGAYRPFLKKVDRFSEQPLSVSLRKREDSCHKLLEIDAEVKRIIGVLQKRGFKSPYLRNYVVARVNPVRFHRPKKGDSKPAMPMNAALIRMANAAKNFEPATVNFHELALVAAVATTEE